MLRLNSALVAIAAEFTGKYAPYQSVEISPAPKGGVFVASTDRGNIACLAYDPAGTADETIKLLPDPDLIKFCRGIKTADRELRIEGNNALVTTFRKSTNEQRETIVNKIGVECFNFEDERSNPEINSDFKLIVVLDRDDPFLESTME